jgi:uncharacterized cupredoxin-like copper-binding protein
MLRLKFGVVVLMAGLLATISASCGEVFIGRFSYDVTVRDFAIQPAQFAVPPGPSIRLAIHNAGPSAHRFAVSVGGTVYQTPTLAPGVSADLDLPGLARGVYPTWCVVDGHREAGMTGALLVGQGRVGKP